MIFKPDELSAKEIYKLFIGSVVPRPIAWVSSKNNVGEDNLAPFSFYNVASIDPPILCFSPLLNAEGKEKDTLRNIKDTKEFVINVVSYDQAEKVNKTAEPIKSSEFEYSDIESIPSTIISPLRVKKALINFECKLHDIVSLGNKPMSGQLVLGKVVAIHVDESVFSNGYIDSSVLNAIGRMAGSSYTKTVNQFDIQRKE